MEFSCKDHEFTFIDPIYGSVAWNNRSWLWTHPRCPALIRYDYYPSKGVFKQKFPKIKPNIKGLQVMYVSKGHWHSSDAPPLSDWQLANGVIRAVTVGQRTPEPEVPPVTELTIEGNIPPPAALLAAIFYKIRGKWYEGFVWSCRYHARTARTESVPTNGFESDLLDTINVILFFILSLRCHLKTLFFIHV